MTRPGWRRLAPGRSSSSTPDADLTSSQTYDALGRVVTRTDAAGTVTAYRYNALGQMIEQRQVLGAGDRITVLGYEGAGSQRWSKSPDGTHTVQQQDGLGRTTATIVNYADGSADGSADDLTTQVVYDAGGRQVETIDAGGTVTRFEYDLLDRLTCVIENAQPGVDCVAAVADPSLDSNVATRYEYDRAGNRTAIIDANGHQRRFSYDAADRLSSETNALGSWSGYQYDRLGRLTITDDPRGDAYDVTYSYDGLGRPTGMAATELDAPITLAYDALGRRTSLSDGTGTTTFTPDALGRITQVTAPDTGTVGYQYNPRGQRTQIRYPDGSTVLDYSYDALGQMDAVQQGSETLASYTYDAAGRLQTIERDNGADTTITYDDAGRIDDLTTVVDGTTMAVFDYTVNRVGQRVQVVASISGVDRTSSYGYDGLGRLTSAVEALGNTFSYGYDRVGNRMSTTTNGVTETASYNAANQRIGWTYDAAGNLTGYGFDPGGGECQRQCRTPAPGLGAGRNGLHLRRPEPPDQQQRGRNQLHLQRRRGAGAGG